MDPAQTPADIKILINGPSMADLKNRMAIALDLGFTKVRGSTIKRSTSPLETGFASPRLLGLVQLLPEKTKELFCLRIIIISHPSKKGNSRPTATQRPIREPASIDESANTTGLLDLFGEALGTSVGRFVGDNFVGDVDGNLLAVGRAPGSGVGESADTKGAGNGVGMSVGCAVGA